MRMRRWLLLALAVGYAVCSEATVASDGNVPQAAHDVKGPTPAEVVSRIFLMSSVGPTTSPFEPPMENDRTFVINSAGGLDTGCTFRSGGPLVFNIEVTRFAGETNPDGTLSNAAALVQQGLLGRFATLLMPAFDVDFDAAVMPPDQPERDRVLFNGQPVVQLFSGNSEYLQGQNNIWRLNSFKIPIEKVKFPSSRGSSGNPPQPAMNEITIQIDVANEAQGQELWCTAIDWAALLIQTTSPVILIHGNSSDGCFYVRQQFTTGLDQAMLLWDNSINFVPNATSIAANAGALALRIPAIAAEFGVDSVHLVCHSKGGLDTREYLALHQPNFNALFKVLSYTSLSTPHNGSVLADLVVARYTAPVVCANSKVYVGFPDMTETLLDYGSSLNNGYFDLQTQSCATFNLANLPLLPNDVVYNVVAADLDQNGNGVVDSTPPEWQELGVEVPALNDQDEPEMIVNVPYQILRSVASITVTTSTNFLGWTTATITATPTTTPLGNDTLVTLPSGLGTGSFGASASGFAQFTGTSGRNHASIANAGVAATVAAWIVSVEQSKGDLQ